MKTLAAKLLSALYFLIAANCAFAQPAPGPDGLIVPILLGKEQRIAGNPLATYAAMLAKEQEYLQSKVFSRVYKEMRLNFEQFLGVPNAGPDAMTLILRKSAANADTVLDAAFKPVSALDVIKEEAAKTQIVIWGEEHHLPQTRSLFESMLAELWKLGYRYLAAETFSAGLRDSSLKYVDYKTGLYTHDPVYASAVNFALALGYKLIDYDNSEYSDTEPSLRDIRQAEYIRDRVLAKDKNAKVLVIAGRGHASEAMAADGWKPMAFNIKQLTGIDPFTIYAPAMTERNTREEEDPLYRYAASRNMLNGIVMLRNTSTKEYVSSTSFDAYVFFPRVKLVQGRPDWLFNTLQRTAVPLPDKLRKGDGLRLVQAFEQGQPVNTVAADQFLLTANENKSLALKKGKYYVRVIDASGKVLAEDNILVAQGNKALALLSEMEEAMSKIKTMSYTSQTKTINSGRQDSVENYTAKCWLKREYSDTIFGAHLHLQVADKKGRADYYYDGINGIDIWHEHQDKTIDKTVTVITPKDLPSGVNDVQARMSLIPYMSQLIDSTVKKWKLLADSMKVAELSSSWVLQWSVEKPRAGVSTLFRLMIDKKSHLISEWHQFTTWNGVRFFTSQLIKDIKVNDAADEENVYLKTSYPSYTTIHFREEETESKDVPSLVNTVLPPFSYKAFSGKTVKSGTQKLLLVDFWETWCGYCLVAMPKIKALHEKYQLKGLEVVGVVSENKTQVEKLLKSQHTPYETVFADKAYLQKLGVVARPRYMLVNEKGMIIADSEGSLEEIEKLIEKLLGS